MSPNAPLSRKSKLKTSGSTGALSYVYVHAIQAGWCSRNSGSVRTRTTSAALYNIVRLRGLPAPGLQANCICRLYNCQVSLVPTVSSSSCELPRLKGKRLRQNLTPIFFLPTPLVFLCYYTVYQASDAPRYFKANGALIGVICFNIAIL